MTSPDTDHRIVYNGGICNHVEPGVEISLPRLFTPYRTCPEEILEAPQP